MLGRAAIEVGNQSDVLAASAHYLRAPEPRPVVVEAELLRVGRSVSQARARLIQDDRTCVEALIVTGYLNPDGLPYWEAGLPQFEALAYEGLLAPVRSQYSFALILLAFFVSSSRRST